MTDPITDQRWREFDELGEEAVRKNLAKHVYGEQNQKLAREWLAHQVSLRTSEASEASLAEARATNALAREANTIALAASASAERSAVAALTNNRIAKAALAVAIIAMITAAIGIFTK